MRFSKGAVARASSITISPKLLWDYLQKAGLGTSECQEAAIKVDGKHDLPEDLSMQTCAYQGKELPWALFYEA